MLRELLEYRPYAAIAQFRQEIGKYVDEAQVAAYEAYLFVPVDPAQADEADVQQLPGVSAEIAADLATDGPFDSADALLAALADRVSPEQATAAAAYLAPNAAAEAAWTKFNLDTATEARFRSIPSVGDQMVREFFEYRPYTSIAQFRQEIGKYVDQGQVTAYEEYVFVPVDPAQTDAATLAQLPGVSAEIAAEIEAAGPYDSADALLAALAERVSAARAANAAAFIATS